MHSNSLCSQVFLLSCAQSTFLKSYFSFSYLHATCDPPILHGNLTCDTIFIQHNGLVKIGSVAPDIIHQNVKTCRDNIARNKHFLAPEWGTSHEAALNTAIDIYAFGVCALETAALELVSTAVYQNQPSTVSNGAKDGTNAEKATTSSATNQVLLNLHSRYPTKLRAIAKHAKSELNYLFLFRAVMELRMEILPLLQAQIQKVLETS